MSPQSVAAGSDVPVDPEPPKTPQEPSERAGEGSGPHPDPAERATETRTAPGAPPTDREGIPESLRDVVPLDDLDDPRWPSRITHDGGIRGIEDAETGDLL
jgi:hypothetical protein